MEIISREQARELGLKYYLTGSACKNGHLSKRLVSNMGCVECIKLNRPALDASRRDILNAYAREYRAKNAETMKQQDRERYRAKNPPKEKVPYSVRRKEAYERNKLTIRQKSKQRYYARLEEARQRNKEYRINNADKINQARRQKYISDPNVHARIANRRAAKQKAVPSWFSEIDQLVISEALSLAKTRTKDTNIEWHVDHIIPLVSDIVCGLHYSDNIRVIPAAINLAKSNKLVLTGYLDWIAIL